MIFFVWEVVNILIGFKCIPWRMFEVKSNLIIVLFAMQRKNVSVTFLEEFVLNVILTELLSIVQLS